MILYASENLAQLCQKPRERSKPDAPLMTEYWDPDGTPAFRDMFQRLEKEGVVLERP
jgi:hypothetical protein